VTSLPIQLRRARKADIPFITSSWLKSFRDAPFMGSCPNDIYFFDQHRVIESLLPRCITLVAVNEDDSDQILGWCAAELIDTALVVHYMYVKHPFRKLGIAKRMLGTLQATESPPAVFYTHKTPAVPKLKLRERGIIYRPLLVYMHLPEGWQGTK
jgi:GNAT superfamily N-acetyltransferase